MHCPKGRGTSNKGRMAGVEEPLTGRGYRWAGPDPIGLRTSTGAVRATETSGRSGDPSLEKGPGCSAEGGLDMQPSEESAAAICHAVQEPDNLADGGRAFWAEGRACEMSPWLTAGRAGQWGHQEKQAGARPGGLGARGRT